MGTTTNPWATTSTGVFANYAAYGLQNVTDGSSNTIAFAEGLVGDNIHYTKWRDGISYQSSNNATYDANSNMAGTMSDIMTCTQQFSNRTGAASYEDKGLKWANGSPGLTIFNTIVPPSSTQYQWSGCRMDCTGCGVDFGQYQNASSNHPGGCNVTMCDGSVRFVKSTIAMQTWWALGTKDDGETISADQY